MSICWLDGELMPTDKAKISVLDHGLLYGDGVFEGVRFYKRQAFRLKEHLQRLQDSATAICLTLPYSRSQLESAIDEVIQAFTADEGYLRLVVTRGKGPLGINPAQCKQATAFIIAEQTDFVSTKLKQQGAKLIIASTRRLPADGLDPRIKSLNYLNHILARMEANQAGADEAILLNAQGYVAEGSTDNIFIIKNGCIFTPPVSDGALQGITRELVIELAGKINVPYEIKTLAPYDLYTADECFLSGTAMELIPVRDVDGRKLVSCPGKIFQQLLQAFTKKIQTEVNDLASQRIAS